MKGVISLVPALFWAAVLFALSAMPGGSFRVGFGFPHMDKVVHLGLYAALGILLAVGRRWSGERFPHLWLLAGGWVYGALDEWHQSFVPGRSPEFLDWVADVVGVTVGYLFTLRMTSPRPPESPEPGEERDHAQPPVPHSPAARPYPASESATRFSPVGPDRSPAPSRPTRDGGVRPPNLMVLPHAAGDLPPAR